MFSSILSSFYRIKKSGSILMLDGVAAAAAVATCREAPTCCTTCTTKKQLAPLVAAIMGNFLCCTSLKLHLVEHKKIEEEGLAK